MMREGKGLLVYAVLVVFARVVGADPVDTALRAGDLREQWAKGYRLVWELNEVKTIFPVDPTAAREEIKALERFFIQQGARGKQLELVRQQLQQQLSQQISGSRRNLVGIWEMEWGQDFLRVRGIVPLEPKGHMVKRWYMGNGWGIQGTETIYAPGFSPPPTPPGLLVWCCEGECFRTLLDPSGEGGVPPEEIALLACLNPLRVGGPAVKWSVSEVQPKRVKLVSSRYVGYFGPTVLEMVLLPERGWVTMSINAQAERSVDRGYHTVTRFRQVAGYWLPEEVKTTLQTQFWKIERTWRLKSVEAGDSPTLAELASLASARGIGGVTDLRLLGCQLAISDYVNRREEDVVYYRWRGRLPTLRELRAIRAERQRLRHGVGITGAPWWRLIPPLLLILIGALWYWRLRAKKVA